MQEAIHSVKYDGLRSLAVEFGAKLGGKIQKERPNTKYDAVVPVPLHRIKRIERGYNQSELLAVGISSVLGVEVLNGAVERIKYTVSQTSFDLEKRVQNMQDAFHCQKMLELERVLLVDDVFTTGATLISAAQALQKAGVRQVTAVTLAVAET
ncbi:MAG: ComF family protein [Chlorobiales bacterium]|nr:ComF family protein [Chlorobiales bacterium]